MKCLTLCWILASCAWAGDQPAPLTLGLGPTLVDTDTTIWGLFTISPNFSPSIVNEGTVTFTRDGAAIAGCQAIPVQAGVSKCRTRFPALGTYRIGASYSGSDRWAASTAVVKNLTVIAGRLVPYAYIWRNPEPPEKPVYGKGLIINALVLGAQYQFPPTGTFTFFDSGKAIATHAGQPDPEPDGEGYWGSRAPLDVPLSAGGHAMSVAYNGDAKYGGSYSAEMTFEVTKGTPVLAISSTPAQIGQPILVSASVTALKPAGTVTFEGIPACARLPLDTAGFARCRIVYSQLGEFPVTATYSGDANLEAISETLRIGVGKAVAGLYVASSPGSPVYGQTVRVSALLMGAPGLPGAAGTVAFTSDVNAGTGAGAIDSQGRASWPTTFPAGVQRVTASFGGDANYAPAMAAATFIVGRANTTTALSAPAAGPFTAIVAAVAPGGGTPTGNVRFLRDGAAIGTAPLVKGAATLVSSVTGNITAEYPGDNNFIGSASSATAPVPKALVMLSSDRNPAAGGQPVTFTAVVMPNPGTVVPAGSVRFTANGAALGTAILAGGRATLTAPLAPGVHAVEASYSGDALYPAASGEIEQVMTGVQSGFGLSASIPAAVFGQPVTFTAQLAAGGTGTVRFSDGATALGSAALNTGSASLTVPALAAGAHTISASWSGDALYAAATAEISYPVARASTAAVLTLGTGAASARVSAVAPGAGTPSGTVRFVHPLTGALLASTSLVNGAATAILPRDAGLVAAAYSGDANFAESVSETASALTAVNAASYFSAAVAPDEIVTLFGPIPAGLATVKVTDRAAVTRDARVLHSVAGQAAIVLPSGLAPGPAVVTAGEQQALVTVAPTAPGLFTADATGKGAPAGVTAPLEIGDEGAAIVLYGTGFRHAAGKPVCTIAGQPVEVVYAGAQGEFPGLDQVNLLLPVALRGAGSAMLELRVDGVAANPLTLTFR